LPTSQCRLQVLPVDLATTAGRMWVQTTMRRGAADEVVYSRIKRADPRGQA